MKKIQLKISGVGCEYDAQTIPKLALTNTFNKIDIDYNTGIGTLFIEKEISEVDLKKIIDYSFPANSLYKVKEYFVENLM